MSESNTVHQVYDVELVVVYAQSSTLLLPLLLQSANHTIQPRRHPRNHQYNKKHVSDAMNTVNITQSRDRLRLIAPISSLIDANVPANTKQHVSVSEVPSDGSTCYQP
jgi:hypothetical protein